MLLDAPGRAFAPQTPQAATDASLSTIARAPASRSAEVAGSGPLALGAFLALALVLRAPAFLASIIDPDEGLYALQAQQWLRGGWPYVAVWDMHPVGAPGLISLALALVGDPVLALRLLGVAVVAATAALLRALVVASGAGNRVGLAAGMLYVAHSVLLGGLATNTELLFAPFCAAGVFWAVQEAQRVAREGLAPRPAWVGAMGLAFGVAFWVKQVVAPEAAAAFLALCAFGWRRGVLKLPRAAALAPIFAAGFVLPIALTAASYALRGDFAAWLDGTVMAPLRYGGDSTIAPGPVRGTAVGLLACFWLLLAALPALWEARRARLPDNMLLLLAAMLLWFLVRTLEIAAPQKFFNHYFLMWLPPLSVLAAFGLARVVRLMVRRPCRMLAYRGLVAIMVALPALHMIEPRVAHGFGWRVQDPPRQIAQAISADLPPGEAIHVVNYHAIVYAMVGVKPLTRYAFSDHLSGHFNAPTGRDMDAELARVLALRPRFLVVASGRWALVRREAAEQVQQALREAYTLTLTVQDGEGPVQLWRRR